MPKKSPDGKLMSIAAYARHRGVVLSAIQDALKRGRITFADAQGKWIDPDVADQQWAANTDASKVRQRAPESNYSQARAAREHYLARLAKLEFEEKSGKLVDADMVKRDAFAMARIVRDRLLNIPDRISAELVSITDQHTMHNVLLREITSALLELCDDAS